MTFATAMYAPLIAGFVRKWRSWQLYGQQVALNGSPIYHRLWPTKSMITFHWWFIGMSYQALALKNDLRFPNELIGMLRMIDDVVCTPFKENSDVITDISCWECVMHKRV